MLNNSPVVAGIVLNCNGMEVIRECLKSLVASDYQPMRLYVSDNGSTDGSPEWIEEHYPHVTVIRNGRNLGWSGANNVGIRKALAEGAEWIWILNNDIELEADCLSRIMDRTRQHPELKLLGPVIHYFEPRDKVWCWGGIVRRSSFYTGHSDSLAEFRASPHDSRYMSGCAMMVHRSVFQCIGLIDERFFIYCEDTDFGLRAGRAGFRMDVVEDAVLYHKVGAFSGGEGAETPFQLYQTLRSLLLFWKKHLGIWGFHRHYCAGNLGKWVNRIPGLMEKEADLPRAEAIMDAVWYVLVGKNDPKSRPISPPWFRSLMARRPWLAGWWMGWGRM